MAFSCRLEDTLDHDLGVLAAQRGTSKMRLVSEAVSDFLVAAGDELQRSDDQVLALVGENAEGLAAIEQDLDWDFLGE